MHRLLAVSLVALSSPFGAWAGGAAHAQARGFDASYGLWWSEDSTATTFAAVVHQPLLGPLGYSVGFTHLDDHRAEIDKTASGAELGLTMWRDGSGPYLLAGVGLGVLHGTRGVDAAWSAGGGYLLRLFSSVSVGLEARYRVEDTDVAGFWRLNPTDRRGLLLQGRVAFGLGGAPTSIGSRGGEPAGSTLGADPTEPPGADAVGAAARRAGASPETADITAGVVGTALTVMGTPYTWGGTDANGFDCSGLIQYAYGEHGIILPRVSRDQLRMGTRVEPTLASLRPGDLLGFSVEGSSRITHVGLYVGEGRFIHSASQGVSLSSLAAGDPDSRWWQQRWVAARRIVE